MTSSVRMHQVVLAASVIVPAILFTAAAWQNRQDVLRESHDAMQRTTAIMQEHARKVFETAELAIGQVDERIEGKSRAEVSAPETSAFLQRLKAPMDQLVSIWIADQQGTIEAGSEPWAASSIADRTWFKAQQEADAGTYIGAVFRGRATNMVSFAISRRRTASDGRFAGTIHVAANPDYFSRFYADAAPPFQHAAILMRADNTVLVREPETHPASRLIDPTHPFLRPETEAYARNGAIVADVTAQGLARDFSIRQVGAYPAYVVFAVAREQVLSRWYRNLQIFGTVAAAAATTLLAVAWLALRRARAEQMALSRLRIESEQRLAAEQQLRHAQRMEAVGQLTGGVAHDFNNLLTAVLGNLELIQRAATTPAAAEKIPRLATTAIKAVHRGSALTRSLLAFSRKQPLHPQPLDANALLRDFQELIRQAVGVGVALTLELAPGLPPCLADPAEVEAAVLNLAINARDAMPEGGTLVITTAATALNAAALIGNAEAQPGQFVAIAVRDSGHGMSPEIAAKAFEPFFTTKPVGKGTGLGLSQVFGLARQLGGHVTIRSVIGQGTAVTLFLPVA